MGDDAAVNGAITRGSYITVYATFDNPSVITAKAPQAQITEAAGGTAKGLPAMTVTLIPAVRVLDVVNPQPETEGGPPGDGNVTLDAGPHAEGRTEPGVRPADGEDLARPAAAEGHRGAQPPVRDDPDRPGPG